MNKKCKEKTSSLTKLLQTGSKLNQKKMILTMATSTSKRLL